MTDQLSREWPSERICRLRLQRPRAYNALSRALVAELRAAIAGLGATRAQVLILAAGDPGFCAGADLKERATMTADEKFAHNRAINALANEIAALPMPTIAAINGIALGGGCEIALACDLRYAAAGASLGLTEARLGGIPGAGGTQRLPRLIGSARALEMMYTGEPITAETAADWGLVNAAVAADALEARVLQVAQTIATRSRRSAARLKDTVWRGLDRPLAEGLEIEGAAIRDVLGSDDYREGLAAFAEKRPPVFD
ncbi:enoyl-CoA hydratase/isomerase family protein [Frigidibacter sp. MR17.24]|uniref:enoyl-CoA hydratase/isomerase family protein n=1 Tax=Frigidibacter sp. MR17.24 TaxID=3127345 RepID=UPI003012D0A4